MSGELCIDDLVEGGNLVGQRFEKPEPVAKHGEGEEGYSRQGNSYVLPNGLCICVVGGLDDSVFRLEVDHSAIHVVQHTDSVSLVD